jgi:intracellular sulfur oxidation DsrE/DsrF family protein
LIQEVPVKRLAPLLILVAAVTGAFSVAAAQTWEYPAIEGFGPAMPLPDAAVQPDTTLQYKIIFDIASDKTEGVDNYNFQLAHVARLINVFAVAGVGPERMKLVAVIHSSATPIVLNAAKYRAKFDKDNPNLDLVRRLREAGVKLYVCGQSLGDFSYDEGWVNEDITVALSAQVVIPTFELRGYAYMP